MAMQSDLSAEQTVSEWRDKQTVGKPIQIIQSGGVAPDSSEVVVKRASAASSIQGSGYTPGQMYSTVVGISQTEQMANMLSAIAEGVQTGIQFTDAMRREQYRKNEERWRKDENTANEIVLGKVNEYKIGDKVISIDPNASPIERQQAARDFINGIDYSDDKSGWLSSEQMKYLLRAGREIDVDTRQLDTQNKTDETNYAREIKALIESELSELPDDPEIRRTTFSSKEVPNMGGITYGELVEQSQEDAANGRQLSAVQEVVLNIYTDLQNDHMRGVQSEIRRSLQASIASEVMNNLRVISDPRISPSQKEEYYKTLPEDLRDLLEALETDPSNTNARRAIFKFYDRPDFTPETRAYLRNAIDTELGQNTWGNAQENLISNKYDDIGRQKRAEAQSLYRAGRITEGMSKELSLVEPRNIPRTFDETINELLYSGDPKLFDDLTQSLSASGILGLGEIESSNFLKKLKQDGVFAPYIIPVESSDRPFTTVYTIDPSKHNEWNIVMAARIESSPKFSSRRDENIRKTIGDTAASLENGTITSPQQAVSFQLRRLAQSFGVSLERSEELLMEYGRKGLEKLGKDSNEYSSNDLILYGLTFAFPVVWGEFTNKKQGTNFDFEVPINASEITTSNVSESLFIRSLSAVRAFDGNVKISSNTITGTDVPLNTPLGRAFAKLTSSQDLTPTDIDTVVDGLVSVYQEAVRDPDAGSKTPITPQSFIDILENKGIPSNLIQVALPRIIQASMQVEGLKAAQASIQELDRQNQINDPNSELTNLFTLLGSPSSNPFDYTSTSRFKLPDGQIVMDDLKSPFSLSVDQSGSLDSLSATKVARRFAYIQTGFSMMLSDPQYRNSEEGVEWEKTTEAIFDNVFSVASAISQGPQAFNSNEEYQAAQIYVISAIDLTRSLLTNEDAPFAGLSNPDRIRIFSGSENNQFTALLFAAASPRNIPIIARQAAQHQAIEDNYSSSIGLLAAMGTLPTERTVSQGSLANLMAMGEITTEAEVVSRGIPQGRHSRVITSRLSAITGTTITEDTLIDTLERKVIRPLLIDTARENSDISELVVGYDTEGNPMKWGELDNDKKILIALSYFPRISPTANPQSTKEVIAHFNKVLSENENVRRQMLGTNVAQKLDTYLDLVVAIASPGLAASSIEHRRMSPSGTLAVSPSRLKTSTGSLTLFEWRGKKFESVPATVTEEIIGIGDLTYTGRWQRNTGHMFKEKLQRTDSEAIDGATVLWNSYITDESRQVLIQAVSGRRESNPEAFDQFVLYTQRRNVTFGSAMTEFIRLGLHPNSRELQKAIDTNRKSNPTWGYNEQYRETGTFPLTLDMNSVRGGRLPRLMLNGILVSVVTDNMYGRPDKPYKTYRGVGY